MDRKRSRKHSIGLWLLLIAVLPILAIVGALGLFAFEMWTQVKLGPKIQYRYGFEISTPYVLVNNEHVEVLMVYSITPGGTFDTAGIKIDEIIIGHTIGGLYRDLNEKSGVTTVVEIVPGGDGLPISQRPVRRDQVVAP